MPKKPQKWGIKIWCLTDSKSKYVYNFDIYCGRNLEDQVRMVVPCRESGVAHEVVMKLANGLENKGHCIAMDNYFTSIPLFKELLLKGIYATGTCRSNRIGLLSFLKNTKIFKRSSQCFMD